MRSGDRDSSNGVEMVSSDDEKQVRTNANAEHRLPAVLATITAIAIYGFLPSDVVPLWLRLPVVGFAALLLIAISVVNPARLEHRAKLFRRASLTLALTLLAANTFALGHTIVLLVTTKPGDGPSLLAAAAMVWSTNLIAFSLLMWELDRGGPVRRKQRNREDLPPADFRFPQDEDADTSREVSEQSAQVSGWRPSYVDYFYEAAIASMAFSPGAGVPVRPRAKLLLFGQSLMSFVLVTLVIAQAVGSLGT